MPNIDNLSIEFTAKGTENAVKNIKAMGYAVRSLSQSVKNVETGKIKVVASSLLELRKNAPSKAQAERISEFGYALRTFSLNARSIDGSKLEIFSKAMEGMKKAVPTKGQVERIGTMSSALKGMDSAFNGVDGSKAESLAGSVALIKKSIPTSAQVERLINFSAAIKDLSAAVGSANIADFSQNMATLGGAVEAFKKSSVNSITNAVSAMQNLQTQTRETANTINSVKPKSQKVSFNNNKPLNITNNTQEIIASLDKVQVKAQGVQGVMQKIGLYVPTKRFKELERSAEKVRNKYEELRATIQKSLNAGEMTSGSSEHTKKMAELDALRNKYNDLILKQKELALSGGAVQLNPTLKTSLEAFSSGFSKVTHLIRNGFVAGIKSANSHLKSFATRIKQTVSAAKNAITSGHKATDMAKKFANELTRMSKMLKLMIVRKALRAVIAEVGNGFQSLAIHSDEFNNAMSGLINGSKKLGYSFAAMVSPLINALAPAIVYVIELLTKLANIINQVFSALTGATVWNKAKNFTDSWRDSIEGAGSAAKKTAKELKKTVLGFDELNQLQDNKDSSSGGGGLADMFETLPIDQKWKDIADWLKKMWEIGDFYELGKKLGEKLRDWLESIPWEKIRETANKLGGALATLINGFVEVERLGYDIGKTIAQSVNTVFEFLNGFVRNLHWASIGKFIADTFNGFFENIDWDLIKDTVITGMRGIAQSIWQFIQEFHWDNISDFIKNGLDTIAKGIRAFFETPGYDDRGFKLNDSWAKRLGKEIGHQLSEVFEDKELWHEVGQALGDLVQGAIDFLAGFVSELDVKDVVDSLTEMVNGFFEQVNSEQAGKTLGELIQKLYDIIKGFWLENKDTLYNEVKEFFGGLFSEVDVEQMAADAIAILSWAANGLITFWDEHGEEILTSIKDYFTGLWSKIDKEALKSDLKEIIRTVAEYAIKAGLALVGVKLVSSAISGIFTRLTIKKAIESALSGVLGEAMGGAVTAAAGSETVVGAATAGGTSIGTLLLGGISAIFTTAAIVATIKMAIDDVKSYKDSLGVDSLWQALFSPDEEIKAAKQEYAAAKSSNPYLNGTVSAGVQDVANSWTKMQQQNQLARQQDGDEVAKWADESSNKFAEWQRNNQEKRNADKKNFYDWCEQTKKNFADWQQNNALVRQQNREETYKWADETMKKYSEWKESVKTEFTQAKGHAEMAFGEMQTAIKGKTADIKLEVEDFVKNIKDFFKKDNWTFEGVKDGLEKTFEGAVKGVKGIWNKLADGLNGDHEIGGSNLHIRLPKFYATGGFPEDGLFFANHSELVGTFSNGKTAVANNAQIVEGIQKGVYSAVSSAMAQNSGSSRYIANEIVVDGEVIARTVTKAQDRQDRRFSPSMG